MTHHEGARCPLLSGRGRYGCHVEAVADNRGIPRAIPPVPGNSPCLQAKPPSLRIHRDHVMRHNLCHRGRCKI